MLSFKKAIFRALCLGALGLLGGGVNGRAKP